MSNPPFMKGQTPPYPWFPWAFPMMSQGQMPMQMTSQQQADGYQSPGPSTSRKRTKSQKPWDHHSSDDEFQSPETPKQVADNVPKRGGKRGRPPKSLSLSTRKASPDMGGLSASQHLQRKRALALPPPFDQVKCADRISLYEKDDCAKCRVYRARVLLKPCGHAAFCFRCVNKLREISVQNGRLTNCPVSDCYASIDGWIQMFHVLEDN